MRNNIPGYETCEKNSNNELYAELRRLHTYRDTIIKATQKCEEIRAAVLQNDGNARNDRLVSRLSELRGKTFAYIVRGEYGLSDAEFEAETDNLLALVNR